MKKSIFFIAVLFAVFSVFSQSDDARKTTFGLYAGGNVSKLLTDSVDDTKARVGYQFGAFFRYGGSLFFRGDVSMHAMSSKLVDTPDTMSVIIGNVTPIEDQVDIFYIHVPLQVGYKLLSSPDGTSALWIAAGGYFDQIYQVKDNDLGITKGDFKTSSFGVLGTVGLDLWILTMQLNYHHGLTPIFQTDDESMKYTLAFSLGIKF